MSRIWQFRIFDVSDLIFQPRSEVSVKTSCAGPASEASLIAEHVCRASADAESRGPRAVYDVRKVLYSILGGVLA